MEGPIFGTLRYIETGKPFLLYGNESEVHALVRLAFYENFLVNGQESYVCCPH